MPESVNGGNSNPAKPPKQELSMEMRLLLAFILMGAVMFVTPYFFKQPPANKSVPAQTTQQPNPAPPAEVQQADATTPPVEAPAVAATSAPGATHAQPEPNLNINTDLFQVALNNRGGTVRSWTLKKYRDNNNKPLDVVNSSAANPAEQPFALSFWQPVRLNIAQTGTSGTTHYTYAVADMGAVAVAPAVAAETGTGNAALTSANFNTISWVSVAGHVYN